MESAYRTACVIGQHLPKLRQPFSREQVFRGLVDHGVSITKAAVSGWINRAVRRGDLVLLSPGQYCLKNRADEVTSIMESIARGEVQEFDVINGVGGLA